MSIYTREKELQQKSVSATARRNEQCFPRVSQVTGYELYFSNVNYQLSCREKLKNIGENWRNLSDSEKNEWHNEVIESEYEHIHKEHIRVYPRSVFAAKRRQEQHWYRLTEVTLSGVLWLVLLWVAWS